VDHEIREEFRPVLAANTDVYLPMKSSEKFRKAFFRTPGESTAFGHVKVIFPDDTTVTKGKKVAKAFKDTQKCFDILPLMTAFDRTSGLEWSFANVGRTSSSDHYVLDSLFGRVNSLHAHVMSNLHKFNRISYGPCYLSIRIKHEHGLAWMDIP
jgi:hypothetical protein